MSMENVKRKKSLEIFLESFGKCIFQSEEKNDLVKYSLSFQRFPVRKIVKTAANFLKNDHVKKKRENSHRGKFGYSNY